VRRLIYGIVVASLFIFTAVAFGFPPATITDVKPDSVTLGGLDCGTQYQIQLAERNASDTAWGSPTTQTVTTAACPDAPPTADFSVSPDPAVRNKATTFTSTGTCAATPCTYRWLHGDASSTELIGTGPTASFTYTGPAGTRTVTLEVTDRQNREAARTRSFQLVESSPTSTPSPSPSPSPTPTPAPSGFPDASDTGVPAGTTLTPSGGMTINTAGAVVSARDISGSVVVNAPNVTIRNTRIRSSGAFPVTSNSTGLVIEDTEIDGLGANGTCVIRGGFSLLRVDIHGCENGMDINSAGNVSVEDSYIHDLDTDNGAHTDGAQLSSGAANVTFRHNTIIPHEAPSHETSGIMIWNEYTGVQNHDILITGNRIIGTWVAFAIYCPRVSQVGPDIVITNNRLEDGTGYTNSCRPGLTITTFSGNVDDSDGHSLGPA
jgi:hypothetical protein